MRRKEARNGEKRREKADDEHSYNATAAKGISDTELSNADQRHSPYLSQEQINNMQTGSCSTSLSTLIPP